MEYVCWRSMLFLIIRLPGAAWTTVHMKPNNFQVSPPKSWCPNTARVFLLMAPTHPQSVRLQAVNTEPTPFTPALCSITQLPFWFCSFLWYLQFSTNWEYFLLLSSLRTVPSTPSRAGFPPPGRLMGSGWGPFWRGGRKHPAQIAIKWRTCRPVIMQLCMAQRRGSCNSNCSCNSNHK